jgi:transposase
MVSNYGLTYMRRIHVRNDISLEEIKRRESKEKRKIIADRMRAIRLAKEDEFDYQEILKMLGKRDPNYIWIWVKRFNEEGFEGLETKKGRGRIPKINSAERATIDNWMKAPSDDGYNVWTAPRLIDKIKKEFSKDIGETAVYNILDQLGYKHRKARPAPSKANKEELEAFKKKSVRRKRAC